MSERASIRGGRGASSMRGGGGPPGGRGGAAGGSGGGGERERPKKENILDLRKYEDKALIVRFAGGREVRGTLRGWDPLMNLTLDDVEEVLRDDEGHIGSRPLGLLVARGTLLTSISPADGSEEIANPFAGEAEEETVLT